MQYKSIYHVKLKLIKNNANIGTVIFNYNVVRAGSQSIAWGEVNQSCCISFGPLCSYSIMFFPICLILSRNASN